MSLYAVANNSGRWLAYDDDGNSHWENFAATWSRRDLAERATTAHGGRVVPLVEPPAKVVVSEEEAEMLKTAKYPTFRPSSVITSYSNDHGGWDLTNDLEDRLMRAYVNGWTVEKPKLFLVKVPHTDDSYFYKIDDEYCNAGDSYHLEGMTDKKWFTIADIEHYELTDCEKVVCADSARTTGEVKDNDD